MKPPSATNSDPVQYELSSEARKAASLAISRGVPVRPGAPYRSVAPRMRLEQRLGRQAAARLGTFLFPGSPD